MNTLWRHSLQTIWHLETVRLAHRADRFVTRLRSPRHAVKSIMAIAFVALYLLAGVTIFSRRDAVDPHRMQTWLSGGMVLYAIYHAIKYLWSARLPDSPPGVHTTPAMALWLGGGPLPRAAIVLHEVARVMPATATKAFLLGIVLWNDVGNVFSLAAGIFLALLTLECLRRFISQVIDAVEAREKRVLKFASLVVVSALIVALGLQSVNETPSGSDPADYMSTAIAEVALFTGSDSVQWLALPLQPASHLAVGRPIWPVDLSRWDLHVFGHRIVMHHLISLFTSFVVLAGLAYALIRIDAWAILRRHADEQRQLSLHGQTRSGAVRDRAGIEDLSRTAASHRPPTPLHAVIQRQLHCIRRYRWNVILSFAIPMFVSLSPLFTNTQGLAGQATKQWVFVIGGIALSSLLLAPPALQIDFRRDLKRMSFLKSFPVTSPAMCAGMLSVPVAITILFQWTTLAVATLIAAPPWMQIVWLAFALPALAALTFAIENALFLAFPHQIHDQGIAMVIRAKLTFLWKGLVLALVPVAVYVIFWASHLVFKPSIAFPVAYVGSLTGCWLVAAAAFVLLVGSWNRFDPVIDTPPE